MNTLESLNHSVWDLSSTWCLSLTTDGRRYMRSGAVPGGRFKKLAALTESRVEEGHLTGDHVHVDREPAAVCGLLGDRVIKGASAIHVVYSVRQRNFVDQHFWARGYFVSRLDETRR